MIRLGRNIPSVSFRIQEKFAHLERFSKMLPLNEQRAFAKLMAIVRERRGAIDTADEDLDFIILLTIAAYLGGEIDAVRGQDSPESPQTRL
ncbi:MAG: hypothetical protein AB1324_02265 [Candidatus Micrarchaeota archaeon]